MDTKHAAQESARTNTGDYDDNPGRKKCADCGSHNLEDKAYQGARWTQCKDCGSGNLTDA